MLWTSYFNWTLTSNTGRRHRGKKNILPSCSFWPVDREKEHCDSTAIRQLSLNRHLQTALSTRLTFGARVFWGTVSEFSTALTPPPPFFFFGGGEEVVVVVVVLLYKGLPPLSHPYPTSVWLKTAFWHEFLAVFLLNHPSIQSRRLSSFCRILRQSDTPLYCATQNQPTMTPSATLGKDQDNANGFGVCGSVARRTGIWLTFANKTTSVSECSVGETHEGFKRPL